MDSSSNHPDWELIGRYLAGEATADEQALVRQWLAAHPEEAGLLTIVDGAASTMAPPQLSEFEVEAALRRVKARRDVVRPRRSFRHPAWVAAAVIGALGIWTVMRSREHTETAAPIVAQVTTNSAQLQTITLDDGSRIIVAPNSEVSVTGRSATLRGQAYFDVVHDEARPFSVRTAVAHIRDVGTAFDVSEDTAGTVVVDVTSGIVELRAMTDTMQQGVRLQQGDRGHVQRGGHPTAERGRARSTPTWTTGRLVFENASMAEVKGGLRRWYGINLQVHDSTMMKRHLTATFGPEPVDQVLRILALAVGGSIERRGNVAILHSAPQPVTR